MSYVQEPPFAIQVELVEGCNLMCDFCGINGIRERAGGYKEMSLLVASKIANDIKEAGWNSRIEFAMHGEPSIHKMMNTVMYEFRSRLDNQLMMTTNGVGFLKNTVENIERLFDAGLNILAVDAYEHCDYASRIREAVRAVQPTSSFVVRDYPADSKASPHSRWPRSTRAVVFIEDITRATKGGHSVLNNHCGAAAPAEQLDQACAKPFRELSVRWDGNISCCCNDWRGIYHIGNVLDTTIERLWQSPRFMAMRKRLLMGKRDFGACKGCNARSYRLGLLPDKFGKKQMDPYTPEDDILIHQATMDAPYSPVVIRPWEIKNAK